MTLLFASDFFILLREKKRRMSECIAMRPTDCLKGVSREFHARKRGVYVLIDKHEEYLIVSQKLQPLSTFLNSIAQDKSSRVSVTALYEILDKTNNRVGGWSKNRWKCRFIPLESAVALFESERGRYKQALILGTPKCYIIESSQ